MAFFNPSGVLSCESTALGFFCMYCFSSFHVQYRSPYAACAIRESSGGEDKKKNLTSKSTEEKIFSCCHTRNAYLYTLHLVIVGWVERSTCLFRYVVKPIKPAWHDGFCNKMVFGVKVLNLCGCDGFHCVTLASHCVLPILRRTKR